MESSIHNEENKNKRNEKKKTAEGASEADIRGSIRRRQHSMKTEQRCGRVAKVEVVKKKKKRVGRWQRVTGDRRNQERVVEEERQKTISRNSKKNNGDQQKKISEKRRK